MSVAVLAACTSLGGGRADARRCAGLPAHAVAIAGDLHAIWGDGPPSFHLQWAGRSARVLVDAIGFPSDSVLSFVRRQVTVQGTASPDTATICASAIALAPPGRA